MSTRARQIAPAALVLGLTVAAFIVVSLVAHHEAHRDAERNAEVAAAQIRGRMTEAASLTESLRRFMLDAGGTGVTSDRFARNALRWLSPADFPAAAWAEQVPGPRRAVYERRLGQPVVTLDKGVAARRSSYLATTVVSGFDPLDVPGVDLSGEPGMAASIARARRLDEVVATRLAVTRTGTRGLFLVATAPNLIGEALHPGYVVVFVPENALRAAATGAPGVRITTDGGGQASFTAAGTRFAIAVPQEPIRGAAALLPWIVLAAGLVLAALAGALGVNRARRVRTQEELDRLFNLSPDLIVVADFEGHFTRVNPAVEQVLGYTVDEVLARPYLDFVHPDDRARTAAEAAAIAEGETTLSFGNRYVRKDGSYRVLDWTATPVTEDRAIYGVARDVTDRRRVEAVQAALRRVATLVAREASQAVVVAAIAEELRQLLGTEEFRIFRYEDDGTAVVAATTGAGGERFAVGSRYPLGGENATSRVFETRRAVRIDNLGSIASGAIGETIRAIGIRSVVATPITVEGRLWGTMLAGSTRDEPLPPETESRLGQFTELMATAIANTESHARAERLAAEQAALRRVATLVASGCAPDEIFAAVGDEVRQLVGNDLTSMFRCEPGDMLTLVAVCARGPVPDGLVGKRLPMRRSFSAFLEAGRPVPLDEDATAQWMADLPEAAPLELKSAIGVPILVSGRPWGAIFVCDTKVDGLPRGVERPFVQFTELVATAIANAQARSELSRLAEEQAALRRVATFVALDVPPAELFDAVAREVGVLLGGDFAGLARFEDESVITVGVWAAEGEHPPVPPRWPMQEGDPATAIAQAGTPLRWNDWADVPGPIAEFIRGMGSRCSVGTPIIVEGRLWGALALHSKRDAPFPPETEARMQQFTDLVGTAVANAEARGEVARLADEQAALRRVATLVARRVGPEPVFRAVADEVAALFGPDVAAVVRFDPDGIATVMGDHGGPYRSGARLELTPDFVVATVLETGEAARFDTDDPSGAENAPLMREFGIRSGIASPVVVQDELWGAIVVGSLDRPQPATTERRLRDFTELVATAVANTQARSEVEQLAERLGALQRVATLVAKESPLDEVFAKVAAEVSNLLGDADCTLFRDEGDGTATVVAASGERLSAGVQVGSRWRVDGDGVIASVLREGRPVRLADNTGTHGAIAKRARELGIRAAAGCPIAVGDCVWGAMSAVRYEPGAFPLRAELSLAQFADLVATAIANAEARAQVERLADEQAALRRVATLVAEGASPTAVLDAAAAEMEAVLDADGVTLSRYERSGEVTVVAHRGSNAARVPSGTRVRPEAESVTAIVRRTERPARMEDYEGTHGAIGHLVKSLGVRAAVGAPIVVDGRLWGVVIANWTGEESPPADTEQRMAQFAELLDTAIANADSRDQLTASRARVLTASDEARRRVVRDLHDGAQQRLVHTVVTLKLAQRAMRQSGGARAESLVGDALEYAEQATNELRELAHGILPAVLSRGGLRSAVRTFVERFELPVELDVTAERFPTEIEASAYFIVAEALTNVVKHSHAKCAAVTARPENEMLRLEIRDDGIGGADPEGHGLLGLADRATALGGQLDVESPVGRGTSLVARLPLHEIGATAPKVAEDGGRA